MDTRECCRRTLQVRAPLSDSWVASLTSVTLFQWIPPVEPPVVTKLLRVLPVGACLHTLACGTCHVLTTVQIDSFTEKFFYFVDGVSQGHRNVDELLGKVRSPRFCVWPIHLPHGAVVRLVTHARDMRKLRTTTGQHERAPSNRPDGHEPGILPSGLPRTPALFNRLPVRSYNLR